MQNRSPVQVIDKAITLMRIISELKQGASALELSKLSGLDRTTVHRILKSLMVWDLVIHEEGMFKSGPESLFYSTQYLNRLNIRRVALPFMIEIQKLLTEKQAVISLSIPVRDHVVLIERIWTQLTPLNVLMDLSDQYLIDKIPSGLAILATYTEENCRMLLDAERYAAVEPRLRQICDSQGFCIGVNEQKIGLNSIAYPIFNGRDEGSGALVIAGLDAEDELALDSMLAGHLKRACENISGQLNYL